ncbi:MAG: hypothetical protein HY791_08980 [Deltaproteobacteria bacterium]|nr:hypothetical protein [Deltaproteobacteria bacterium]
MRITTVARGAIGTLCFLPLVCGAGPAAIGTEVTGGFGGGQHRQTIGCATTSYYDSAEVGAHLGVRHRLEGGLVAAAEASATASRTRSANFSPAPELGRTSWIGDVAARAGYHSQYVGFELGPALAFDESGASPFASGQVYLGKAEVLFGYASLLEGPLSHAVTPLELGLGHSSERLRVTLGVSPPAPQNEAASNPGVRLALGTTPTENLWLGVNVSATDEHDWNAMGTVAFVIAP